LYGRNWSYYRAVTTPTQLPGLTVCGAPAPEPAPAVVTKEYEWSLGGITEDTYVTLTYTNPDGTTGGLSDYYGALGSQYIFCARQNTATASHGIITLRMPRSTSPAPAPAPAPAPEPEPTTPTEEH
jgi:hypothetical protein